VKGLKSTQRANETNFSVVVSAGMDGFNLIDLFLKLGLRFNSIQPNFLNST
jgi:hypothetical protein